MVIEYADAAVSILKRIGDPTLTLMSVAKPWIVSSPAPSTSHSDAGEPALLFSHEMALPPTPHGSAKAADAAAATTRASGAASAPAVLIPATSGVSSATRATNAAPPARPTDGGRGRVERL